MSDRCLLAVTFVSAIGCGVVGRIFFAFSAFVMKALARLPTPQGIAAMQSINVVVINPSFLLAFFGTALGCLIVAVSSLLRWQEPGVGYLVLGSLLYLFGTILVTFAFNVPRNDALAAVDPASSDGARLWADYMRSWTIWNHVRAAAATAAAVSLTVALALVWGARR